MKIIIKGFIKSSLLDWDGKIVSTLYVPHCNMRCPFCQNAGLLLNPDQYPTVKVSEIKEFFLQRKDFMDGICLTGGEPSLYEDILEFLDEFKKIGCQIKLDTNGTFPDKIKEAIKRNLVDYIAMDIKGPLDFDSYRKSSGLKTIELFERVKDSIKIIMDGKTDYEFRTTVVPTLHNQDNIEEIARYIKGAKKYALQNFQNQDTLDESFKKIQPYKREVLEELAQNLSDYAQKVVVRGRD